RQAEVPEIAHSVEGEFHPWNKGMLWHREAAYPSVGCDSDDEHRLVERSLRGSEPQAAVWPQAKPCPSYASEWVGDRVDMVLAVGRLGDGVVVGVQISGGR